MPRPLRALQSSFRLPPTLSSRFARGEVGPIGLQLGGDRLRMVQLERRGEEIGVRAAVSQPAPDELALRNPVRAALRAQPFRGRSVVTVLPPPGAKLMVVNYQLDDATDEPQRILGLVQERIDEPIAECVVDYQPIRADAERGGPRSALVAVAREAEVVAYLERLRAAGLEVAALEIVPVAVHRLVGWLSRENLSSHSLVLHCGRRRTHLIGLAGRRLVLYQDIEFGGASLVEALAKTLEMHVDEASRLLERYGVWPDETGTRAQADVAEALEIVETVREIVKPAVYALAEQVERAAVYTASQWRGAAIDRILLLGDFAAWPGIDRLVQSLVSIPTEVLDPLAGASACVDDADDFALAMGLALRGLQDGD